MGRILTTSDAETIAVTGANESEEIVLSNGENIKYGERFSVFMNIDVQSPAAGTFTAAASDICTKAAHGYQTGLKGDTSTDGVMPGGLSAGTHYIIRLDANTFKFASTYQNALDGVAEDITDAGTGNHTFTPAALSGMTYSLKVSPDAADGTFYTLLGPTAISADADVIIERTTAVYKRAKIVFAASAGQAVITLQSMKDIVGYE